MDELDPQVIAAVERAAREASDPQLRDRLSAAAAIFAALARRDDELDRLRAENAALREIAQAVAAIGPNMWNVYDQPTELTLRARALLEGTARE